MDEDSTNPNLEPVAPESPWPADPGPAADPTVAAELTASAPVVDAAPPGDEPPSKPSWKTWVAVAATAAVVGAAAVFGISAATSSDSSDAAVATNGNSNATQSPNGQGSTQAPGNQNGTFARGPGGFGTITSIDGTSLEMKDQQGTTTKVVTTDSTKVTTTATGSLDDVKVGDNVMVVGTGSETAITATQVTDNGTVADDATDQGGPGFQANGNGPPSGMNGTPPEGFNGSGPPNGAQGQMPNGAQGPGGTSGMAITRGVVKSVSDGKIVVTSSRDDTDVTVTTSSDTKVSVTKDAKLSDLKVGDSIVVVGDESDGTLTATSISEGSERPMFNRQGTNGGTQ